MISMGKCLCANLRRLMSDYFCMCVDVENDLITSKASLIPDYQYLTVKLI